MKSKRRKLTPKLIEKRMKREDNFNEKAEVEFFDKSILKTFIFNSIFDRLDKPMINELLSKKDISDDKYIDFLKVAVYIDMLKDGFRSFDSLRNQDELRRSINVITNYINNVIYTAISQAREIYINEGIEDLVRYIKNPDFQEKYHGEKVPDGQWPNVPDKKSRIKTISFVQYSD